MSAPWSPSAAREAARAALYRAQSTKPPRAFLAATLRHLLREDVVFDSHAALREVVTKYGDSAPRELLALVEPAGAP